MTDKQVERIEWLIHEAEQEGRLYYNEVKRQVKNRKNLSTVTLYRLLLAYTRKLEAVSREVQIDIKLGEEDGMDIQD